MTEVEFKQESPEAKAIVGDENYEVFLATCNNKDDRLLFVKYGELIMGINIKGNFVIQTDINFSVYKNLKKISLLEVKAILEAN